MGQHSLSFVKLKAQDGWRQGRKGLWKGEAEGRFKERQGWTSVPCRKDPSSSEEQGAPLEGLEPPRLSTALPSLSTSLLRCSSWLATVQGFEGEEDHSKASAAGHQRRRGVGHSDQGHHRRGRRHPPYPQVPHRQEGRRTASPVEDQYSLWCGFSIFWYIWSPQRIHHREMRPIRRLISSSGILDMRQEKSKKKPMKHRTANVQIFRRGQFLAGC